MVLSDFAQDWNDRYLRGTATFNHIERLYNIGRLTEEEFKRIIVNKRLMSISNR